MMSTSYLDQSPEQPSPGPRLWREAGFAADEWTRADALSDAPAQAHVILPLQAFLQLDEAARTDMKGRIGVQLAQGEAVDAIVPHLGDLPLVSLAFPAFNDGRSYSKAQLLRARHGYGGTIRATGDVLIDQIPLMLRTGFSEFEVGNPTALARLAEGRLGGIAFRYQPAAAREAEAPRYSWRRMPAA